MGNGMAATARRNVALIGANYGLALHPVDRDGVHVPGEPASCFATFWVAEWSKWGSGTALLVATLQGWRSYGPDELFASTLASELTRYLPEAARFPLNAISHTEDEFHVQLHLEQGFKATGRRAALEIYGVLDRRQFAAPDFQLGPVSASMSNVYLPCRAGRLSEFGIEWPGAPTVYPGPRGPSSSAYLAVAESWTV